MSLDETVVRLPLIGIVFERMYAYFRRNIALTDIFHVLIGAGLGFLISGKYVPVAIVLLVLGTLYHLYALAKGQS